MLTAATVVPEFMAPVNYPASTGYIEFVAVAEKARWHGIATKLVEGVIAQTPHTEYMLEVTDVNTAARDCYRKIGFADVSPEERDVRSYQGFPRTHLHALRTLADDRYRARSGCTRRGQSVVLDATNSVRSDFTVPSTVWLVIGGTSLAILVVGATIAAIGRSITVRSAGIGLAVSAMSGWVMIAWIRRTVRHRKVMDECHGDSSTSNAAGGTIAPDPLSLIGFVLGLLAMSTTVGLYFWLLAWIAPLILVAIFVIASVFVGKYSQRLQYLADGALAAAALGVIFAIVGAIAVVN